MAVITLAFDPRLAAPFDLVKTALLWIVPLGFCLDFFYGPFGPKKPLALKYHPLIALFWVMFAGFLPSLFKSQEFYSSFFGAYPYFFGGLLTWVGLGFLLFLSVQVADEAFCERLLKIAMAATVVASIYAGIQILDLDPTPWQNNPKEPFSTLGGGLFFGGYLALMTPMALAFYLKEDRPYPAAAALILLGIIVSLLLKTLARSAWLGALAGVAVFFWHVGPGLLKRRALRLGAIGAVVGGVLLWYLLIGPALRREPSKVQDRAKVFLSSKEGSAKARLELWTVGVSMWLDHPWVGIGFDNVEQYFWLYRSVEHLRLTAAQATTAPLHNDFLQILTTAGLVGFIPYAAFLLYGAYCLWRVRESLRAPESRLMYGAFSGAIVALGVFGQFNFSVAATSAWVAVLLGCLAAQDRLARTIYLKPFWVRPGVWTMAALFLYLLVKGAMIYSADLAFARANLFAHKKNFPMSDMNFSLARRSNPNVRQYHYGHGAIYLARSNIAKTLQENLKYLELAQAAYEEIGRRFPWNSLAWHNLATVLESVAKVSGRDLDARIKECMRKAVSLFPVFPRNLGHYGEILYAQDNKEGARRLWERALDLDPRYVSARRELERFKPAEYIYFFNQDVYIRGVAPGAVISTAVLKLVNEREEGAETSVEIVPKEETLYSDISGHWDLAELGWANIKEDRFVLAPNTVRPVTVQIRIPRWPWWRGKKFVAIIHAKDNSVKYPFGAHGRIIVETIK